MRMLCAVFPLLLLLQRAGGPAVELRCQQPMRPGGTVTVDSRDAVEGSLRLLTILGREVASVRFETARAGRYRWRLPADGLSSGVYALSAEWSGGRTTRLILLLR